MLTSNRLLIVALTLVISGCARNAPDLPVSSPIGESQRESVPIEVANLGCGDLNDEILRLAEDDQRLESKIQEKRKKNQAIGYVSAVLFPPILLGAENQSEVKESLDKNQQYRDHLITAMRVRGCRT